MGDQQIKVASKGSERISFIEHLLDDIRTLERMLANGDIEQGPIRVGAEQEFCLVDEDMTPSKKATSILNKIGDKHFTHELALYNLEINLDPELLDGKCFSEMRSKLEAFLSKAKKEAHDNQTEVVLCGILPSISGRHVEMEYMTPSPRYKVLNEMMKKLRGSDFSLHIMGADELTILHDSVLFEACNTSFQAHLQIDPNDFVSSYNWAQAISGPVLAIAANSPLLLGRELWKETRIALFQQSIDTRKTSHSSRQNEPRVTFGSGWVNESISDIYKDDISRFQIIVHRNVEKKSSEIYESGEIPKLEALALHNGTIYRWNRPCYGVAKGVAHIRIENRYLPSGPTVQDEIANFVFWVGLMKGRPSMFDHIQEHMEFKEARDNFTRAARYGKDCKLSWMGNKYNVDDLIINTLLPIARKGLEKVGIDNSEIEHYLNIIENRTKGRNGAEWTVDNFRLLRKHYSKDFSLRKLTELIHANQNSGKVVSEWADFDVNSHIKIEPKYVYEIMSTSLLTIKENDSAALAKKMMQWNNVHHMPVENEEGAIVGLLTDKIIESASNNKELDRLSVSEIMVDNVLYAKREETIDSIRKLMIRNEIGCVPVVKNGKLIGLVTKRDLN
jgi:CBS domain-containing protein/gamma-glutamylcysteine synthetase